MTAPERPRPLGGVIPPLSAAAIIAVYGGFVFGLFLAALCWSASSACSR